MSETVQMGLRAPIDTNARLEAKAQEIGVSKNALALILLDLGFKAYEGVNHHPQSE
jgi:hypothetical protein